MHLGHMASHVCGTWQAMCVTPACHVSSCMSLLKPINMGVPIQFGGQQDSVRGSSKKKEEEGKREREERKREREEKKRKGKKKREEEERGGREEKKKRKRKKCCAVSRPGWQRTRNYATRGRFPPTLVILRLGAV